MDKITKHIRNIVVDLFNEQVDIELTRTDEQFGDYATNVAMRLSKKLSQNPREVAQKIVDNLNSDDIAKAEVAGPGFINLTLSDELLLKLATPTQNDKTSEAIVIETNNPNPFKAMHIGHAFNAILGDTIANLLDQKVNEVHRVSYHGDVGAHVGRSMYSLLKFVGGDPSKLNDIPVSERNKFMSKMYADGTKAYKEDPNVAAEIDELSKQSFSPEGVYKEVYETCKKWSFEQIDSLVKKLGNKPVEKRYLEGQADALGVEIVKANVGDVFFENDGALVFPGSKYGTFDNVFVASTGRGLYGARDLGLMKLKYDDYHPVKSYIVTAEEQKDYFKGAIKAAELIDESVKDVTVNISTGTVKLSTGKMSSRSGDVLEIGWLFDQMAEAMKARGGQATDEFVSGALRYQFLKVKIGSDVVFDVEESVTLQGNSGPYLQYAHARAKSILSKAQIPKDKIQIKLLQAGERSLLRKISEFNEVIDRAVEELLPHYVCTYLYELAQVFNRFYEKNKVIGDEREDIRLQLVSMYAKTLKSGLDLLGIYAPEKM